MKIQIKQYYAQSGSALSDEDAQIIGPVLQELATEGDVTASAVVEAAHSKNSPLHKYFEWDDQKAAGLYREGQAHEMIQSVRVTFVSEDKEYSTRAYNVVSRTNATLPREIEIVPPPTPTEQISSALRELDEWRWRYRALTTLKKTSEIIRPILNQISEFEEDIKSKKAVDLEASLKQLTEWKTINASKILSSEAFGEHYTYMCEAIESAWELLAKAVKNSDIRSDALEEEIANLTEEITILRNFNEGPDVLPSKFNLTPSENTIVIALARRDILTSESAMHILYSDKVGGLDRDEKIIDVFIHKIRRKLSSFGIEIETTRSVGYKMPSASKKELESLIVLEKAAA